MKKLYLSIMAAALLVPTLVVAADFRTEDDNVTLKSDETANNLYTYSDKVSIKGKVLNDLFVAGSEITLEGPVENSVAAAGSSIDLSSTIGDNVRLIGSTIDISGKVGEDLLIAGSDIELKQEASIGGDAMIAGSIVDIAGNINGDLFVTGGKVTISGVVFGNVVAREVTELIVTDGARVQGNLTYYSQSAANIASGATISGVVKYNQTAQSTWYNAGNRIDPGAWLIKVLGLFVFTWLLIALLPKLSRAIYDQSLVDFWPNLGIGFAALILIPIASIILMIMYFTAGIGITVLALYTAIALLSSAAASIVVGGWLKEKLMKIEKQKLDALTALYGTLGLSIVGLIPYIGWFAVAIIYLVAFGILIKLIGRFVASNKA